MGFAVKAVKTAVKPPTNTLDRWFKPAPRAKSVGVDEAPREKPKAAIAASSDVATPPKHKPKAVTSSASKNFVQRYIHITDECRVCESARTEEATRCELRCIGCSMTVHKKCYGVKSELPDGDWNCRRCQFIYDETHEKIKDESEKGEEDPTSEEDTTSTEAPKLIKKPEEVVFPTHDALDDTHEHHALHRNCDFAAVFLFLQRFRRLGLKISNAITLEYPPAIANDTTFPALGSEEELHNAFYFDLPVHKRVAMLKFLCEIQFDRNDSLVELIDDEDADTMVRRATYLALTSRNDPIGTDAVGRSYFILEDAATVPDAAVWVCRCAKIGGVDWETVSHDVETLESLVEALALAVDTADLQLWQTLSDGVLKKLTRRRERQKRNERWQSRLPRELGTAGLNEEAWDYEGIGRRSLRTRRQVNYTGIIEQEDYEDEEEDDEKGDDDEEVYEAKSSDEDAESETDEVEDAEEEDEQPRRTTRRGAVLAKKRNAEIGSLRSSKRRRELVRAA
ncbi:hypothetical protein BBJ28_00018351 [Nothophytophthora sp. Chile5]|nr:hypothetical protein BBJ28_00018351 [Nothophytophthora sp. Chile5]